MTLHVGSIRPDRAVASEGEILISASPPAGGGGDGGLDEEQPLTAPRPEHLVDVAGAAVESTIRVLA